MTKKTKARTAYFVSLAGTAALLFVSGGTTTALAQNNDGAFAPVVLVPPHQGLSRQQVPAPLLLPPAPQQSAALAPVFLHPLHAQAPAPAVLHPPPVAAAPVYTPAVVLHPPVRQPATPIYAAPPAAPVLAPALTPMPRDIEIAKVDLPPPPIVAVTAPQPMALVVPASVIPAAVAPSPQYPAASSPQTSPTVVSLKPPQKSLGLGTQYGLQVGVEAANYRYSEPGFADTSGYKAGIDPAYTLPLSDDGWFGRLDGRYANGRVIYSSGSGMADNLTEWTYEARLTFGKDFYMGNYALSPYFGGGYRRLFNDINGVAGAYDRESNYFYLPVGITHRIMLDPSMRVATNFEYDYLAQGEQESKLGSVPGLSNVVNEQNRGFGLRTSVMLETGHWSAGPWFTYWDIKASGPERTGPPALGLGAIEPSNRTYELGGKVAYHFD